ncbi:hypothetical protein HID58_018494 [Brassica napus]|uniref:Uncharacterized protein n=1 Tax=Brassica napus TaxID=3708 RepID=A0ABQ8DAJ7_BRANA|nr:hypothetical protein HID58_018494 [Brassica napus]
MICGYQKIHLGFVHGYDMMGRLFWLVQGLWTKADNSDWSFEEIPDYQQRIRITTNLGILMPVVLTYQLLEWMLLPDGPQTPPTTLLCDKDVETMTSVRDYMTEAFLYVTSGPEHVAKYQFQRRYPFTLVGGHPIVCSKHMLEVMFNEPQLLIGFRVALEIEMVYANTGVTIYPEDPSNFDPYEDEVLYGEPMNHDELEKAFPNSQEPSNINLPTNGGHQTNGDYPRVPPTFEDMDEEEAYWNGLLNEDVSYEVYVNPPQPPLHGVTSLPIGPNRRISAEPPPHVIVIQDDDDASHTGSSDGINDNDNIITLNPAVLMPMTEANPVTPQLPVIGTTIVTATVTEPSLDLTLGIGNGQTINPAETVVYISDSSSEAEDVTGNIRNKNDDLYEGNVFKSRVAFKQHMAIYALENKFRFRNARSSPDGMVLTVYTIKIKNVEKYKIRRLYLEHTCSVDERAYRRDVVKHRSCKITPRVVEVVEANFEQSGWFQVNAINTLEFELKDRNGASFHTLMIPCSHAIATDIKEMISVESLVSEVYSLDRLTAYRDVIFPICDTGLDREHHDDGWLSAVEIFSLQPDALQADPMKNPRKRHVCNRCKTTGHNRATCKAAI